MDINDLRSIITVLVFLAFVGIVWWAYSDRRKDAYDKAARSVLEDDTPPSAERGAGQTNH
ncbi:cbb3-type cytochrome oxidase subunit 3 [Sulfurisoma sediminicola]|uniref:Cytochrome c oxidase cbb3-type subunit 4 n=1 Tax=Sulfurisoma sediminicola TaxID=1381557 RepID=A0A497XAK0_9PROT|nr:cbb3-type cytochrome c oxidase subunit 3 [Sulfurisoma sediminicola]RLJ63577.1 cytochrome c oxidase cbb3-type subunit 4 [Sulfurisoma sediminicola]